MILCPAASDLPETTSLQDVSTPKPFPFLLPIYAEQEGFI